MVDLKGIFFVNCDVFEFIIYDDMLIGFLMVLLMYWWDKNRNYVLMIFFVEMEGFFYCLYV